MDGTIVEETGTEAIATAAQPGCEEEQKLADEISELWASQLQTKSVAKKTKEELKSIRERLGKRLHEMKQLLARPGRNGQWSAWLKERKISRATADRLVQRFAATLPGHESTHESIEDSVEKLAKAVWARIQKVLTSDEAVIAFIASIADLAGIACEQCQDGLLISEAVGQPADGLPGSSSATELVPHPPDEVAAISDEPGEDSAAALRAAEQTVGAADADAASVVM